MAACLYSILSTLSHSQALFKQLHQLPDPNAVRKKGPYGGASRSLGPLHVQRHTDGFCLSTLKSKRKHARLWSKPNFQVVGWLGLVCP